LEKMMISDELIRGLGHNLYTLFPHNAVNNYTILINKILNKK